MDGNAENGRVPGSGYDPAEYARGSVGRFSGTGDDDEPDGCGLSERGHVGLLGLFSEQGLKNIPYHGIDGVDQDDARDCRWIEINFHAVIELADEHGELAKRRGDFKARIEGERLESLMRQIRVGRRVTIHKNRKELEEEKTPEDAKKPRVDRIAIEVIEADAVGG